MTGGSSGLELIFSGTYYQPNNAFYGAGQFAAKFANFATSSESGTDTWIRNIGENPTGVTRDPASKLLGNAVRCIKDEGSQPCAPQPDQADAGTDQLNVAIDSVILAANDPVNGTGQWTILSGTGGTFTNDTIYNTVFHGTAGETYQLEWSITTICGSTSDTVEVSFLNIGSFTCGQTLYDTRDSQTYGTIEINNQCWMTENLNYGNYVTSTQGQSNNQIPEKFCYGNDQANCETLGGLYTWDELMEYATTEGAQGFCPDGWHVPTDNEWLELEVFVDPSISSSPTTGYRGTDAGTKLKTGGSSGLDLIFSGAYFQQNNAFYGAGQFATKFANYASSSQYNTTTFWIRTIEDGNAQISRTAAEKVNGSALRCIKDTTSQACTPQPDQASAGPDQTGVIIDSVILAANNPVNGSGQWTIISGIGGSFSDDTLYNSVFYGSANQSYQLEWTITTICGSTSDNVTISFACFPEPDAAYAGEDTSNIMVSAISLYADVPSEGTGVWTINSGQGGVLADSSLATSTFTGISEESYELIWTVSNSCGTNSDTVNISFACFPEPSTANAGEDTLNVPVSTISLNADDPAEGTGVWTINSGQGGVLADSSLANSMFTGISEESYELLWTVSNACGTNSDAVNISFACFPDPDPAYAGEDSLNIPVDSIILNATVPSQGTGAWTINSGIGGSFSDSTSASATFYGVPGTTYELIWTVSNPCGSNSDTVTMGFYLCTPEPSQAIAGNDILNAAFSTIVLNATEPTEGDGIWTIISGNGGSLSDSSLYNSTFYGVSNETYNLVWTVSNQCGSSNDTVVVSIACFPNPSPAVAGSDQLNVTVDSVILGATQPASGSGVWSVLTGTGGSFSDSTAFNSTFYGVAEESYELIWSVSNACGTNTDTVSISFTIPCPSPFTDTRDMQQYTAIKIGSQCWMGENLNYGTMIPVAPPTDPAAQSNNSIDEKYCYNDSIEYCNTYGGLYLWNELMQYTTQEGVQGLCPPGWHVPTDLELFILENYLDSTVASPDSTGFRGTDIGTKLKVTGSSGMDMLLSGKTQYNEFFDLGQSAVYLSSTQNSGEATWMKWARIISDLETRVDRSLNHQNVSGAVRCLKD